jgi:hypothetical protein
MVSEGGLTYERAKDTCQSFSAHLFYLYDMHEFQQFELKIQALFQSTVSNAVTMFFRLGAWIDKLNSKIEVRFELLNIVFRYSKSSTKFRKYLVSG